MVVADLHHHRLEEGNIHRIVKDIDLHRGMKEMIVMSQEETIVGTIVDIMVDEIMMIEGIIEVEGMIVTIEIHHQEIMEETMVETIGMIEIREEIVDLIEEGIKRDHKTTCRFENKLFLINTSLHVFRMTCFTIQRSRCVQIAQIQIITATCRHLIGQS
jgi:hypothetical protein